jgi:hypothetical protein
MFIIVPKTFSNIEFLLAICIFFLQFKISDVICAIMDFNSSIVISFGSSSVDNCDQAGP